MYKDRRKMARYSRDVLRIFDQVQDVSSLEDMVTDLISYSKLNTFVDKNRNIISLMNPKDRTKLIRLLGFRDAYDAMLLCIDGADLARRGGAPRATRRLPGGEEKR